MAKTATHSVALMGEKHDLDKSHNKERKKISPNVKNFMKEKLIEHRNWEKKLQVE